MKSINLFGDLQEIIEPRKYYSSYQLAKLSIKYRLADDKKRSCKYCSNCFGVRGYNKTFYKCKLIGNSSSEATDIKLKMTCNEFTDEG